MLRRGRAFLFVGLAGLALALLGQLDALGPITAAGITVASSVGLALIAHGGAPLAGEAVAFGASGAVAYEATRSYVPLIASGLLLTFVFGTRAMRSRTWRELGFHLALAFASGVAASWVARANAGLEASLWMTAIMVASLLASAPWIVPNDAPRTFALRRLASRARGATGSGSCARSWRIDGSASSSSRGPCAAASSARSTTSSAAPSGASTAKGRVRRAHHRAARPRGEGGALA